MTWGTLGLIFSWVLYQQQEAQLCIEEVMTGACVRWSLRKLFNEELSAL